MHRLVTEHRSAKLRALLAFCLLTGVFAASETAAQQPRLLSLEPETESPLPPQANTPTPLGLYRDGVSGIDGLHRDLTSIVSADGSLLFAASTEDNALSVWRVNTDTGSLTQSALYKDGEEGIDGLDGAHDLALSPDGRLLFVTASGDNALSVWRVNATSGTLARSALYQDGTGGIDGLGSAFDLALSPDGSLLFVTAPGNNALSVWRVDATSGTLAQGAVYRSVAAPLGVVSSPDGRLLFVTGFTTLSVWRVNASSGTLAQSDRHQDPGGGSGVGGLFFPYNLVLSPDGSLLFVTAEGDRALSVWRVSTDTGTVARSVLYTDDDGVEGLPQGVTDEFDGLNAVRDVEITQNGSLLYVAGRDDESLSIWQVNAVAGTLTQSALYKDDDGVEGLPQGVTDEFDGLSGPYDLTLSPDDRLLFVTAIHDRTLSVFRTALPRLFSTLPIMLKAQVSAALPADTTLVITARQGDREVSREAVFSAGETSAAAVFEAGALAAGRWTFTMTRTRPSGAVRDTASVQATAMVVNPQPVTLELTLPQERILKGGSFTITLASEPVPPPQAGLSVVLALTGAGMTIATQTATLTMETPSQELTFTVPMDAPDTLMLATLTTTDENRVEVTETIATVTAIQPERLRLSVSPMRVPLGSPFRVTLTTGLALPPQAELSVVLTLTGAGVTTETRMAILTAMVPFQELTFIVPADAPSILTLAARVTDGRPLPMETEVMLEATAEVMVIPLQPAHLLSLQPEADAPLPPQADPLTLLELYRDGVSGIDGLNRDLTSIVSADGSLLFAASTGDNALSVWRVNIDTGSLTQSALYKDRRNGIDGLNGARDLVLSPDGSLLFVTASGDNALSVWRVNATSGTLAQSALYKDGEEGIDGLNTARDLALSPDGSLLFVTGPGDHAFSVWRVDAASGTLAQGAVYGSVTAPLGVVSSPDGSLLFVTGFNTLSVWRVNAASGTLAQSDRHQDPGRGDGVGGLFFPYNLVLSPDGSLLFVTSDADNALSVWRVSTDTGTVARSVLYTDDDGEGGLPQGVTDEFDGLNAVRDVEITRNGSLLYVAGRDDESLSIWQVNAVAGTLTQSALYKDDDGVEGLPQGVTDEFDGLSGTYDLMLSPDGSLLFVTAIYGRTLSVFRTPSVLPRLLSIAPIMLKARVSTALPAGTVLVITARRGDREVAREAVLSAGETSATAVFEAGALAAGRWTFTVTQTRPSGAVQDTAFARATVLVVQPQLVDLELGTPPESLEQGSLLSVTLTAVPAPTATLTVQVNLTGVGMLTETRTTVLTAMIPAQVLRFTVPANAPETLMLATETTGDRSLVAVSEATATVTVIQPVSLMLSVPRMPLLRGSVFAVTVTADPPPPLSAELSVVLSLTGVGVMTAIQTASLTAAASTAELTFIVPEDAPAALMLATETAADVRRVTVTEAAATAAVIQSARLLSLQPEADAPLPSQADTPTPLRLYRDGVSGIGGLRNDVTSIVSADGSLLFTASTGDDALGVWRVSADTGGLTQSALYKDGRNGIDGLDGARDLVLSSDDSLLFVTASDDNALSVWRVNAADGTLAQSALYEDETENIDGLGGVRDLVLSSDDSLLYVTASGDNALSVWGVNAADGTLTQRALYREGADDIGGLASVTAVALSPDGHLLFTGSDSDFLSVWQVNAADGTLVQNALYENGVGGAGLDNISAIAPSPDGRLLFIAASHNASLVIWRVNTETGTLLQRALYLNGAANTDGSSVIDGLAYAYDLALTQDGSLLYATGRDSNALSLWQVNAEDETLGQTALYKDDDGAEGLPAGVTDEFDGLGGAYDLTPSPDGSLLYVTASQDRTLSVFRTALPRLLSIAPITLRARVSTALPADTALVITARQDDREAAREAVLSAGETAASAVFEEGVLAAGRWIFTVTQIRPPGVVHDTASVQATVMVVQPQLVDLELRTPASSLEQGLPFPVTLTAVPAPAAILTVQVSLAGGGVAAETTTTILTATTPAQVLHFTVPADAPVALMLETLTTADRSLVAVSEATATVTVIQPISLMLRAPQTPLPRGSTFAVTVTAEPPPPAGAELSVQVSLTADGVTTATRTAILTAMTATLELTFTVPADAPETLILATETTADERLVTVTEAEAAAVTVIQPISLMLSVPPEAIVRGSSFAVTITADPAPPAGADLNVALSLTGAGMMTVQQTVALTAAVSSQVLSFTVPADASADTLVLATRTSADEALVTVSEATAMVTVLQPRLLSLQLATNSSLPQKEIGLTPLRSYKSASPLDGLSAVGKPEVSPDGRLLFTPSVSAHILNVWRVSTATGALERTAQYKSNVVDPDGFKGLFGVDGLELSADASLLFVTAIFDDALSVWQVNAAAGTLTQTALYIDNDAADVPGAERFDGLSSAGALAFSSNGDLLFYLGSRR